MPIETPAWVRDAIFYQIFPDRFAMSDRVVKPGPLEPWDAPPTVHGFKGGDLYGVLEHLDHIAGLGVNALYFNPIFQSASNHRYHTYDYLAVDPLLGGDAALRELHRRMPRARACGSCSTASSTTPSRGFWPFHHVLETGRASPYRDWFFFDHEASTAGRPIRAYPLEPTLARPRSARQTAGRGSAPAARVRGLVGPARAAEAQHANPRRPRVPVRASRSTGSASASMAGGSTSPTEIRDERSGGSSGAGCRAVNPEAYIVGEIWHEAPEWPARRHVRRGDELPAGRGDPRLRRGGPTSTTASSAQHHDQRARPPTTTARRSRRGSTALMAVYDPAVTAVQLNLLDSHDTPRFLSDGRRRRRSRCGWPRCSR